MLRVKNGIAVAALIVMAAIITGCPAAPQEQAADPGASVAAPATPAAAVATGETCPDPVPGTATAAITPAAAPARPATTTTGSATVTPAAPARLPRLVDLGRGTCIPCKMMAPILEQLKTEYAGRVVVEVIDLSENMAAAQQYGIRSIPTQIFFDASGNEVSRHEGFLPKEDIVRIFQQLGVR
ncbi:MAG TPA: thioredoxin family protein [bacterium]|nr:thioredoxin family protein [bacterium]